MCVPMGDGLRVARPADVFRVCEVEDMSDEQKPVPQMSLPKFLEALSQVKGTWRLSVHGHLRLDSGACPLTAVCSMVKGMYFDPIYAYRAGVVLGLTNSYEIVEAADNQAHCSPSLRALLIGATNPL